MTPDLEFRWLVDRDREVIASIIPVLDSDLKTLQWRIVASRFPDGTVETATQWQTAPVVYKEQDND